MRAVLSLLLIVAMAPVTFGHAQDRPTPRPRPVTREDAVIRVNGLLKNINSGALFSLRAFLVADDRALTSAMAAANAHFNQHGMDYLVVKGRAEDVAKLPGTLCDAVAADAATVAELRPRLDALIPEVEAAVATAEITSYACQSVADADRLDSLAKKLAAHDGDLTLMNTRYTDAAGRLLAAFNKRADLILMETELRKRQELTRAVWRTHYPQADRSRKQYERAVSDAVLEWSVLETVATEFGIGDTVQEVKTALATAANTVNQLKLAIDDPSIAESIKNIADQARLLDDAVAAVDRAKRYYACNAPQPPMGPAPAAEPAIAKARVQAERLANAAKDCLHKTALPDRFGFLPSEVTLRVGQTMSRPPIFGSFNNSTETVNISDRVTFRGVPIPFTPLPEQAGSVFSLTATLAGRSSTLRIRVAGASPFAGTWDLTGTRTLDGKTENANATLTLTLESAAAGAALLEGQGRALREACTKFGAPVVFSGSLVFAQGARFPKVVACLDGLELTALFHNDTPSAFTKGWFILDPVNSSARWELGDKFMRSFDWAAKNRDR